jgi:hypothetical protein
VASAHCRLSRDSSAAIINDIYLQRLFLTQVVVQCQDEHFVSFIVGDMFISPEAATLSRSPWMEVFTWLKCSASSVHASVVCGYSRRIEVNWTEKNHRVYLVLNQAVTTCQCTTMMKSLTSKRRVRRADYYSGNFQQYRNLSLNSRNVRPVWIMQKLIKHISCSFTSLMEAETFTLIVSSKGYLDRSLCGHIRSIQAKTPSARTSTRRLVC